MSVQEHTLSYTSFGREAALSRISVARERMRLCLDDGVDDDLAGAVTIIIKTFERPLCVANLLVSIRRFFPTVTVLVCDDSRSTLYENNATPLPGVHWLCKDFSEGHTAGGGRNFLIDRVETPYYFQCDDDHVFVRRTNLPAMKHFLDATEFDLVGGCQGRWDYGTALQEREGSVLRIRSYCYHDCVAPGVVSADRVSNTFMARTETMKAVRWEDRVNANTHSDYFLRAREAGKRIAQMGGIHVLHGRGCEPSPRLTDRIKGIAMGHSDPSYRLSRLGAVEGQDEITAEKSHWNRHKSFVLEKNGLTKMSEKTPVTKLFQLYRTIGHPALGKVRYAVANGLPEKINTGW